MPVAIPVSKSCPRCGSEKSTFVAQSALSRLFGGSGGLKKYRCDDCGHLFQAADRRRFPRSGAGSGVDYQRKS